ncbi:hypothetical protein DVH05_007988 [Phytophthora capsici]|nr:hypothetical protein DVH05_007988 [Phytophthora capsici]
MLVELRAFLALVWWHICHFLAYHLHVRGLKPSSQFLHKVVVIGDDFAAGIGDYITIGTTGGIAEYLQKIVEFDDKVRHNWAIINAAVPGSMTADWLMTSPKKYFKNVFTSRAMGDASIVIIILGSVEIRNSGAAQHEMRRNLVEICDTLRKKGKQVCLATVASPDPTATDTDSASSTLNTALEQFCKRWVEIGSKGLLKRSTNALPCCVREQHIDGRGTRHSGTAPRHVRFPPRKCSLFRQVPLQLSGTARHRLLRRELANHTCSSSWRSL